MNNEPLRILQFTSENVKRLKFVEIDPNKNFVVIAGNNGQGKSSILDSIAMALGGKSNFGPNPINTTASAATVSLDFGRFKVTRTIKGGSTSLKIEGADGEKFSSPQTLLDDLIGEMFDPWKFAEMKKDKLMDTLKQVVGVDFSALDAEHAKLFAERTHVNASLRLENARLADLPHYGDVKEKVDVSQLVTAMENAQKANMAVERSKLGLEELKDELNALKDKVQPLDDEIERIKSALAKKMTDREGLNTSISAKEKEISKQQVAVSKMEIIDVESITKKSMDATAVNAKVDANTRREDQRKRVSEIKDEAAKMTKRLDDIKAIKAEKMSRVKFPVPELTFDDEKGVLYNGIEFENASSSERLKASVAMGVALYPKMPIMLVRRGSDLDLESLRTLHHLAVEKGAQIWIERVGEDGPATLIIEDGSVKEVKALSI